MLSLLLVVLVIGWCILLWLFWDYYVCCDFNDYLVYLGVIGYWVLVCVDLEWVYVFCDGELVVDYEWIWVVYQMVFDFVYVEVVKVLCCWYFSVVLLVVELQVQVCLLSDYDDVLGVDIDGGVV